MTYFVTLLRYIHQNPVKAGMVREAKDYPWSSWHEYLSPDRVENICNTRATLRRISIEGLAALVNRPLADDCTCIDIDEADIRSKSVHTDEIVRNELLRLSQCQTVAEFQRKDITERKQICRQLKELGAGVRQLSRLTGISLGTISGTSGTGYRSRQLQPVNGACPLFTLSVPTKELMLSSTCYLS